MKMSSGVGMSVSKGRGPVSGAGPASGTGSHVGVPSMRACATGSDAAGESDEDSEDPADGEDGEQDNDCDDAVPVQDVIAPASVLVDDDDAEFDQLLWDRLGEFMEDVLARPAATGSEAEMEASKKEALLQLARENAYVCKHPLHPDLLLIFHPGIFSCVPLSRYFCKGTLASTEVGQVTVFLGALHMLLRGIP